MIPERGVGRRGGEPGASHNELREETHRPVIAVVGTGADFREGRQDFPSGIVEDFSELHATPSPKGKTESHAAKSGNRLG